MIKISSTKNYDQIRFVEFLPPFGLEYFVFCLISKIMKFERYKD